MTDLNKPIPFEAALCKRVVHLMRQRHAAQLEPNEKLEVDGELSHGHALARLVLFTPDRTSHLRIEVSVPLEANQMDHPGQARDLALDFMDGIFDKFLAEERLLRFQPDWKSFDFEGKEVLVRGAFTRPALEDEADRLLAAAGFDMNGDPIH